jgi:phosphate/sulfate permease
VTAQPSVRAKDSVVRLGSRSNSSPLQTSTGWRDSPAAGSPLPSSLNQIVKSVLDHIRDGRFQRSMSFVSAGSSFVSALEVGYEHYKGSYSNPVMYTPVALSVALTGAATAGTFNTQTAQGLLRITSAITLIDGIIGFGFHIRGVARKPGGWRLPITNIVMGPPIFAPLLFGTAAYLGLVASYLRPEECESEVVEQHRWRWQQNIHEGRFQKQLTFVSAVWAVFSGFEAWYSHYKNNFQYRVQWSPVLLTPVQLAACVAAMADERAAKTLLPAASAVTLVDGLVGFGFHARGIVRRPGGRKTWLYNVMYGPPIFAPLLFAACGALGLLASLLRREKNG